MKKNKKHTLNGKVYEGGDLIDLLHEFFRDSDGERLIALPSLNDKTPGLFDDYTPFVEDEDDDDPDDPDMLEMSRIVEGDKIRILTDVLNNPDWRTLYDFLEYPEIEIRHVQNLDMFLFVRLGQKRAFSVVCPTRCNGSYNDFEDESVATETTDYETFQRLFETLWEDAEPITCEKIEHFNELWSNDREDFDKELLEHTYFLFVEGKKNDDDLKEVREENVKWRSAFSSEIKHGELGPFSFAYIVGIKIPRDAEQIVICHVDEKANRIKYDQTFRVFGNNPICEIDDTLHFYYPERGFSIVQGWDKESSIVDNYRRPKCYYSKKIYMAMRTFDFEFGNSAQKIENALSKKLHSDATFADSLKETCFVKWSSIFYHSNSLFTKSAKSKLSRDR